MKKIGFRILYKTLHKKTILLSAFGILMVCLAVSAVSFYFFHNYLRKSLISSTENSVRILSESINGELNEVLRIARFCQGSSDVATYIEQNPNPETLLSLSTYDRLYEEYSNNTSSKYIARVVIATQSRFLQVCQTTYSSSVNLSEEIPKLPFYDELISADTYKISTGIIADPFLYRKNKYVFPIIRPISYKFRSEQAGVLYMEVTSTLFSDTFSKYTIDSDSDLFLTLGEHVYHYADNELVEVTDSYTPIESSLSVPLSIEDCYLTQTLSDSALNRQFRLFLSFYILVLIIIIGAGVYLLERRLSAERKRKNLEYQVLQNQINPHFLYNTLNSIKFMAEAQGARGISEMTTALSRLLRSISKGTSQRVSIKEEMDLVKDYFTIQNYRYGGMISFYIEVTDDEIFNCDIIKFTLQPIVENAIFHGIEPKGGTGEIHVKAAFSEDKKEILISVTDNGVGMDRDKIEGIFSGKVSSKAEFFKEIGITNVHARLKYEFGEKYGITIDSKLGEYTTMCVHLPRESKR